MSVDDDTSRRRGTAYVDIEVGIVNVQSISRLLEVDMGNAIYADVVVIDDTERSIRQLGFDKFGSSIDIALAFDDRRCDRLGFGDGGIDIRSQGLETEGIEIDRPALESRSNIGRGMAPD